MNSSATVPAGTAAAPAVGRDFPFSSADFQRVKTLIHRHAGISLADSKKEMAYSRLTKRLRATGDTNFGTYLDRIEVGDSLELEQFANALTTNLTSFFREAHHFPILAEHMLSLRRARPLRIWCSAASTGEEPYSIAMTLANAFGTLTPNVQILATDIDTDVLETARRGVYDTARVDSLPSGYKDKYFLRGRGPHEGKVRIRPELASLVTFKRLNLLDNDWLSLKPFDAMFCRNVMIYFDKTTQLQVLKKFAPILESDGLFFAGHSETFFHAANVFRLRGHTVYEKVLP